MTSLKQAKMYALSERLVYSRPDAEDEGFVCSVYTDAETMAHLGGALNDARVAVMMQRWDAHWETHGFGPCICALKDTGERVGVAGAQMKVVDGTESADIGWMIHRDHRRKGYASEAASALLRKCIAGHGLCSFVAWPDRDNTASIKILQKLGFTHIKDIDLPFMDAVLQSSVWRYEK